MFGMKLVALMLAAALNPLVVRAPEPHGNVPADCATSDRPAMPRVQITEVPPPAPRQPAARPAATRTVDFAELDRAIANNDRPAFDAALARARAAGLPVRKYEDVGRLWDAQFESPFFAQDSDAYRIASNYPGYEEAMRRHVFTDASGRKFYPASESRAFVGGVKSAPATTTRTPAPTTRRASASPAPSPSRSTKPAVTSPPRRTTTRPRVATNRTESRQPAASRDPAPPSSSPDPSAPPRTAATEPAPAAPAPVVDTSSTEAPPVAGSLETAPPAPATDTAASGTTATAAPDTTATTEPAPATTPAAASKGRPILLPAVLILIGLGVLILLFRTKA